MRRLLTALIIVPSLAIVGSASGGGDQGPCQIINKVRVCLIDGVVVIDGTPATQAPPATGGSPPGPQVSPPVVYVSFPRMGAAGDGSPCLIAERLPYEPPAPPAVQAQAEREWQDFLSRYPMCPGTAAAMGTPAVVYAYRLWQEAPLPAPAPYIAPGRGLTGKPAYLETRGRLSDVFRASTPLGPLEMLATGRYWVDWGDGTTTGPYDAEGAPWPDGTIRHTYVDVGHYRVVVTEQWSSTWRLGDASGTFGGLSTTGRIDDLRVEQIQVVVTPG